jgi:hypothetical protein
LSATFPHQILAAPLAVYLFALCTAFQLRDHISEPAATCYHHPEFSSFQEQAALSHASLMLRKSVAE